MTRDENLETYRSASNKCPTSAATTSSFFFSSEAMFKILGMLWVLTSPKNFLMDSFLLKMDTFPDFDVRTPRMSSDSSEPT